MNRMIKKHRIVIILVLMILALYVYSWTFGVPAVHSDVIATAYSVSKDYDTRRMPAIHFHFTIPIFPFIILSKHTCMVDGWNDSGIHLYYWFFKNATRINGYPPGPGVLEIE